VAGRVTEAANALPKRGLEVCGLLLGELSANEADVKSLIPLPCSYAQGPAFRFSEQELRSTLETAASQDGVVGFYRSRTDGSLDLDDQDRLLIGLLARQPMPVLVIRQHKDTSGEGRLLMANGTGVISTGDIFPIREWMAIPPPRPKPPTATLPMHPRAIFQAVPVGQTPAPPPFAAKVNLRTAWSMAILLVLLVPLILAWQVRKLPTLAAAPPPAELETPSVPVVIPAGAREPQQSFQTVKSWIRNKDNATLREIAVGLLARHWKNHPETLPLLRHAAQTDPNETVRAAAREATEGGSRSKAVAPATNARTRPDQTPAIRPAATRLPANTAGPIESNRAKETGPAAATGIGSKLGKVARLFRLPWPRAAVPPDADLPTPPPQEATKAELPKLQLSLPNLPGRPSRAPGPVAFRPPTLARRTAAVAPPLALQRILQEEIVISLRVHVDAKGRVARIEAPKPASRMELSLQRFYAAEVRRWLFDPARRGNTPVTGETTLHFRATPRRLR
jgi:hypothetical protein